MSDDTKQSFLKKNKKSKCEFVKEMIFEIPNLKIANHNHNILDFMIFAEKEFRFCLKPIKIMQIT